jgi:hypothetical protein
MKREIALYLSEFKIELDRLNKAVRRHDVAQICHNTHLLYGRSAFIAEKELEQSFRQIEMAGATSQWDEVRRLSIRVEQLWVELKFKLTSV